MEANRFSRFIRLHDQAGLKDLAVWQEWFKSRGIASVVVITDKGYALYREGMADEDL